MSSEAIVFLHYVEFFIQAAHWRALRSQNDSSRPLLIVHRRARMALAPERLQCPPSPVDILVAAMGPYPGRSIADDDNLAACEAPHRVASRVLDEPSFPSPITPPKRLVFSFLNPVT